MASKWNILGKLHEIRHCDCKNIQEFVAKIRDIKSGIEDLETIIDEAITIHIVNSFQCSSAQFIGILSHEAITIQIINFFDFYLAQFIGISSHEAREKEEFPTLESLAKFLENK